MKKIITSVLCCYLFHLATPHRAIAQTTFSDTLQPTGHWELNAGLQIGGTTPWNLPNTIRAINGYTPQKPFFLGVNYIHPLCSKWSVRIGAHIENKGMYTEATVKGYETEFNATEDGSQSAKGFYYGRIATQMSNLYLTIPLSIQYNSTKWKTWAGGYLGLAIAKEFKGEAIDGYLRESTPTGELIGLKNVAYNFDYAVRTINVGMQLGAQYYLNNRISATIHGSLGLNNTLKSNFESVTFPMHHVYLSLGLSYKIK